MGGGGGEERKGYGRHAERENTGDGSSKGAGSKGGIEGNYAAMLNISQAKPKKNGAEVRNASYWRIEGLTPCLNPSPLLPIKITKGLICRCASLTYSPVILTLKSTLNLNCILTCTVADSF